jgi:hypothetical protein
LVIWTGAGRFPWLIVEAVPPSKGGDTMDRASESSSAGSSSGMSGLRPVLLFLLLFGTLAIRIWKRTPD